VHGDYDGQECKAELVLRNGKVVRIIFHNIAGRPALAGAHLRNFKQLVRAKADDIVRRWVDFFVLKKHNKPEIITRKLKMKATENRAFEYYGSKIHVGLQTALGFQTMARLAARISSRFCVGRKTRSD